MLEDFFLNRKESEKPEYERLLRRVRQSIDGNSLEFLPYVSFLMLKPDAYLRGLIPAILSLVRSHRVYPIRYDLLQLTEDLINNLYMFVRQRYSDTWWVMKKAYLLAPCLPMLVVGSPEDYPHLSARMRAIVGPTTPKAGQPGQLRYDFRATHRVFNLIHGTDDPASAIREALVFFDITDIKQAIDAASRLVASGESDVHALTGEQISGFVPAAPVDLAFERVKLNLKSQLLAFAEQELSEFLGDSLDPHLQRLRGLLASENALLAQMLPLREESEQLRPMVVSERTVLYLLIRFLESYQRSIARAETPITSRAKTLSALSNAQRCFEILGLLADRVQFSECNFDAVIGSISAMGLDLSPLTEVILHTGWAVAPQELQDTELDS